MVLGRWCSQYIVHTHSVAMALWAYRASKGLPCPWFLYSDAGHRRPRRQIVLRLVLVLQCQHHTVKAVGAGRPAFEAHHSTGACTLIRDDACVRVDDGGGVARRGEAALVRRSFHGSIGRERRQPGPFRLVERRPDGIVGREAKLAVEVAIRPRRGAVLQPGSEREGILQLAQARAEEAACVGPAGGSQREAALQREAEDFLTVLHHHRVGLGELPRPARLLGAPGDRLVRVAHDLARLLLRHLPQPRAAHRLHLRGEPRVDVERARPRCRPRGGRVVQRVLQQEQMARLASPPARTRGLHPLPRLERAERADPRGAGRARRAPRQRAARARERLGAQQRVEMPRAVDSRGGGKCARVGELEEDVVDKVVGEVAEPSGGRG
mmetsp:Transcript_34572/g.86019  ORF Transcript_34572/g.86019 Transcript_34572/m.86019 type:complete len:381 (-) Transcript_34572:107-1249(-)